MHKSPIATKKAKRISLPLLNPSTGNTINNNSNNKNNNNIVNNINNYGFYHDKNILNFCLQNSQKNYHKPYSGNPSFKSNHQRMKNEFNKNKIKVRDIITPAPGNSSTYVIKNMNIFYNVQPNINFNNNKFYNFGNLENTINRCKHHLHSDNNSRVLAKSLAKTAKRISPNFYIPNIPNYNNLNNMYLYNYNNNANGNLNRFNSNNNKGKIKGQNHKIQNKIIEENYISSYYNNKQNNNNVNNNNLNNNSGTINNGEINRNFNPSSNNSLKNKKNMNINNNNINNNNNIYNNNNNNDMNKIKKQCFNEYFYSEYPNLEHRKYMEDFHRIIANFSNDPNKSYFAIFDGHGGEEVSNYLKDNLHNILSKELKDSNYTNIEKSLESSFKKIDEEINLIHEMKKKNSLKEEDHDSDTCKIDPGSTATLVFLYQDSTANKKSLYCANVGDSKCFLFSNKNELLQISIDHKCSDENEVKRIKSQGGVVFGGRVFGTLMLTRSIGDSEMKKYGVIPTPSIYKTDINNNKYKYCIIASDGLWDVIEESQIKKLCNSYNSAELLCKKLISLAIEGDTRDNASCIVIKL